MARPIAPARTIMVSTPSFTDGTWNIATTLNIAGDPNGDILWQNLLDQSLVLWQQDGAATTSVIDLLRQGGIQVVVYGHLHGIDHARAIRGERDGLLFWFVAADAVGFAPMEIPNVSGALGVGA